MTDTTQTTEDKPEGRFIAHLGKLDPNITPSANRKALAELRRSLSFDLGAYIPAYPYVEPFVAATDNLWRRNMFYLVAGLYATHPAPTAQPGNFGRSMAILSQKRDSGSLERRFLAMLAATEESQLAYHLRQLVSLLKAEGISLNYAEMLRNLNAWQHPDRYVQRNWARSYYTTPAKPDSED